MGRCFRGGEGEEERGDPVVGGGGVGRGRERGRKSGREGLERRDLEVLMPFTYSLMNL